VSGNKIAVFPGSFDPFTIGHVDIINRAVPLFDQIIIAIGFNSQKKYLYPIEKRIHWIEKTFAKEKKVTVDSYSGLTVDFCEKNKAGYILRGLRSTIDFEYEKAIGQMNHEMKPGIETIFILAQQKYTSVNSTIVRDIIMNGGDASAFLPEIIAKDISGE
jgi:pantetheine-phosphate adenylyltransferase